MQSGPALIDLRSDTVTLPTDAMRRAMADAELGDDVFGEDPTVNRLQELAADRLGKEAGLLVTSGTMGNLVSLLTHCRRGDEAIMGIHDHIFRNEQGGIAALGGIHSYLLPNEPDGTLDLSHVEAAIPSDNDHAPRSRVVCVENTHNERGGRAIRPSYLAAVGELARRHALRVHVDGARIFNATIALGVDVRTLAATADSLTFCLSKGLACPVGSVIVGDRAFIQEARRNRKVVGGGMRQAGVIAAAGIVALNEMVERLAEDHRNAKRLAQGLADIAGIRIEPAEVETNILFFELEVDGLTPSELAALLKEHGVAISHGRSRRIRLVTHHGINAEHIERALLAFHHALSRS